MLRSFSKQHRRLTASVAAVALAPALVLAAATPAAAAAATPKAWGENANGQLGDGTLVDHATPKSITGTTKFVEIGGGREHVIARDGSGGVWTWGDNRLGQLGNNLGPTDSSKPVKVTLPAPAAHVETGHYASYAVLGNGSLWAWGYGQLGQLGQPVKAGQDKPLNYKVPVQVKKTVNGVTSALDGVVHAAGGREHAVALRSDGTIWGWGNNANGEVGNNTTTPQYTAVRVAFPAGAAKPVAVAAGRNHSFAILADGKLYAWGDNYFGQLGDGTKLDRKTPTLVKGITVKAASGAVAAGAHHSLAIGSDGSVRSWGRGYRGQLGRGSTVQSSLTPAVVPGLTGVSFVGAGRDHSMAVKSGQLYTFGRNTEGQIGNGAVSDANAWEPFAVPTTQTGSVVQARGGENYTVALPSS